MNRIILIGNGFDLAHGLPTSYGNFIEWYWRKWRRNLSCCTNHTLKDELCVFSLKNKNRGWLGYMHPNLFYLSSLSVTQFLHYIKQNQEIEIHQCEFLKNISNSVETKGWGDI